MIDQAGDGERCHFGAIRLFADFPNAGFLLFWSDTSGSPVSSDR